MAFLAPAAAQDPAEPAGPALWKVADEDTTIYLFGTVHALPSDVEWFDERIAQAFESSDVLVTEVDMGAMDSAGAGLLAKAMITDGQTLRSLMDQENREAYESTLTTLGLPAETLDSFEPWYAAMTLTMLPLLQAGYGPDSGVEMVLGARWGAERERDALETVDEQLELFDTLPMDVQLNYLADTVDSVPRVATLLDTMVAEWLAGDEKDLGALLNAEMDDPLLYDRLLIDRNRNWAAWIHERMDQPGTVFIAVGAGHLAGDGSVQDQLEAMGMAVERVE